MKVVKLLPRQVQELSPLVRVVFVQLDLADLVLDRLALFRGGIAIRSGLAGRGAVDQLEDLYVSLAPRVREAEGAGAYQGPTGDDACPSGQEVSPDNVFEHGRLARGLRADDGDLRQVLLGQLGSSAGSPYERFGCCA